VTLFASVCVLFVYAFVSWQDSRTQKVMRRIFDDIVRVAKMTNVWNFGNQQ